MTQSYCCAVVTAVNVIKKTWESDVKNLIYFSDVADESIPTVSLGIPNTERGSFTLTFTCYCTVSYK